MIFFVHSKRRKSGIPLQIVYTVPFFCKDFGTRNYLFSLTVPYRSYSVWKYIVCKSNLWVAAAIYFGKHYRKFLQSLLLITLVNSLIAGKKPTMQINQVYNPPSPPLTDDGIILTQGKVLYICNKSLTYSRYVQTSRRLNKIFFLLL